jgi:hypothetical protein
LEISVSFLGIHKSEANIYNVFSPALHLQYKQRKDVGMQGGACCLGGANLLRGYRNIFVPLIDKKQNKIFLIYKEIQKGAVAKSYMRKGFLIYEEMRKYMRRPLVIYDCATAPF